MQYRAHHLHVSFHKVKVNTQKAADLFIAFSRLRHMDSAQHIRRLLALEFIFDACSQQSVTRLSLHVNNTLLRQCAHLQHRNVVCCEALEHVLHNTCEQ
jgi:hypothetical protein